jgi:hypothetical protein
MDLLKKGSDSDTSARSDGFRPLDVADDLELHIPDSERIGGDLATLSRSLPIQSGPHFRSG